MDQENVKKKLTPIEVEKKDYISKWEIWDSWMLELKYPNPIYQK